MISRRAATSSTWHIQRLRKKVDEVFSILDRKGPQLAGVHDPRPRRYPYGTSTNDGGGPPIKIYFIIERSRASTPDPSE